MTSGFLGSPSGNVIVPVANLQKRTKELTLVLTTDITCTQTGFSVTSCKAIFYSDSSSPSNWRVKVNLNTQFNSASITDLTITFTNLVFKSTTNQAASGFYGVTALSPRCACIANTGQVAISSAATTANGVAISFDVELNAEPTTYTVAANMEGAANVAAYIPPASATQAGLLNYYEEYSDTTTVPTCAGATVTNPKLKLVRVNSSITGYVQADLAGGSITGTSLVWAAGTIPSRLLPLRTQANVAITAPGASGYIDAIIVSTDGSVTLSRADFAGTAQTLATFATGRTISYILT